MERICYECHRPGHIKRNCSRILCYHCQTQGHIAVNCPGRNKQRCPRQNVKPKQIASIQLPHAPVVSAAGDERFHGHSCATKPKLKSVSSASSEDSRGRTPWLEKISDIRSDEAVARVADALTRLLEKGEEKKYYLFRNKQFIDFQDDGTKDQVLYLPKGNENLRRGDFDIIVIHPINGYIHIEVKATGDCPESQSTQSLLKSLMKALKTMEKGKQALQHLQLKDAPINILTTLALPNIYRAFLCQAFQENQALFEGLTKCINPRARGPEPMDIASLCLCSDDLPPKDEIVVDESALPSQWWSKFTETTEKKLKMTDRTFQIVVHSFLRKEEVTNFPQLVVHTAASYKPLTGLTDTQKKAVENSNQYVFVSGPPGSGKTLVLAEKCAQRLENGEQVFLIYKHGKATSQPAIEGLVNFVKQRLTTENKLRNLHRRGLKTDTDIGEFMKNFMYDMEKDSFSPHEEPGRLNHESDEIKMQSFSSLQSEFSSSAFCPVAEGGGEQRNLEKGRMIHFVIDELTRRTIKGKRSQLIRAVQRELPGASIWCAGPIPMHCPEGFQEESMPWSFRCPPHIQRILEAVEPFCRSNDSTSMFRYATTPTSVPTSPETTQQRHRLPCEGPEPFFISHACHKATDIINCRPCSENLVTYLINELRVTKDGKPGPCVHESDVLVVLTGTYNQDHMHVLGHSELYRQLSSYNKTEPRFRINLYCGSESDNYDLDGKGISMMHVRAVAGVETKVVVFVPCRQFQDGDSHPHTDLASVTESQPLSPTKGIASQRISIEETLRKCRYITNDQVQSLARLGHLNLHWMWYAVSRSLSHAIIFHF